MTDYQIKTVGDRAVLYDGVGARPATDAEIAFWGLLHPACTHAESFEDGTQRFCSNCGDSIAYVWAPTEEWRDGAPDSDFRWTDMGFMPRRVRATHPDKH